MKLSGVIWCLFIWMLIVLEEVFNAIEIIKNPHRFDAIPEEDGSTSRPFLLLKSVVDLVSKTKINVIYP